mmetsp:Transcript_85872/g.221027  ORF Transcript_85872/g.221027 Transcript_85872/m.221027 type:complete len:478 (+) Transcript_85872:81-1514(+)
MPPVACTRIVGGWLARQQPSQKDQGAALQLHHLALEAGLRQVRLQPEGFSSLRGRHPRSQQVHAAVGVLILRAVGRVARLLGAFRRSQQVPPGDHAADRVVLREHRHMPQPHGAEEHVATDRRSLFGHRVCALVHVRPEVEHQAAVQPSKSRRNLIKRGEARVLPGRHVHIRYNGHGVVRERLVVWQEGPEIIAEHQHPLQRAAPDDAEVAASVRVHYREAVVPAALEHLQQAAYGLACEEADDALGHDVLHGQREHVRRRSLLQQRHVLQLDVDVVQALVEEVTGPFGRHDGEEDRQPPLSLARGLHEDHRQRDGDAGHARQEGRGTDQRVDTVRGFHESILLHHLPDHAAENGAAQQRGHEEPRGHAEAVGPAGGDEVHDAEDEEPAHVEVFLLVEQLVDGVTAILHEQHLCGPQLPDVRGASAHQRHEEVERCDRGRREQHLDEAAVTTRADVAHPPLRQARVQPVEERASRAA